MDSDNSYVDKQLNMIAYIHCFIFNHSGVDRKQIHVVTLIFEKPAVN